MALPLKVFFFAQKKRPIVNLAYIVCASFFTSICGGNQYSQLLREAQFARFRAKIFSVKREVPS